MWLIVAAAALWAASGAGEAGAKVVRERLASGLTVLVRENPSAPVVAVSLLVRAGGRWEDEENSGITNLLQQVMVKGTTSRSALEIAEAAEAMGGGIGASTDMDFAEIRGTALARHWRRLLQLIADVTLRPSFADEEIANERRVLLSRIRSRRDQPFPLAFDTLLGRLYGAHPYARPVMGRAEVLERLDRAALTAHHRRYYRPERMVLSVSGQVPAREVAADAVTLFAQALPGIGDVEGGVPPPTASHDRLIMSRPAAQAQVVVGFLAPALAHPDYAAVKVLSTALGGGMASRLFTELRDKQGLAYSTGALYPSRVGQSFFVTYIGTAPASASRTEEGMTQEIERIRRERLSAEELARAKAYLLGQFALDRRTNARLAWYQAFFESTGLGYGFADAYTRAVEAVSAEDVQRVANAYLASPTIVRLEPPPK